MEVPVICAGFFSAWEIAFIVLVPLIVSSSRHLPGLGRGLRRGFREFGRATRTFRDELDDQGSDAGRSIGGIYGKPAREALTPDNQTAEIYDPAAGSFTATNSMTGARSVHTATLLNNGQVLIAGGSGFFYAGGQSESLSSAELLPAGSQ